MGGMASFKAIRLINKQKAINFHVVTEQQKYNLFTTKRKRKQKQINVRF